MVLAFVRALDSSFLAEFFVGVAPIWICQLERRFPPLAAIAACFDFAIEPVRIGSMPDGLLDGIGMDLAASWTSFLRISSAFVVFCLLRLVAWAV